MIHLMPFRASQMRRMPDQFCDQLTRLSSYLSSQEFLQDILFTVYPVGITIVGINPAETMPPLKWEWKESETIQGGWTRIS